MPRAIRLAALVLAAPALLAACDDSPRAGSLEAEVSDLHSQVKRLETERDRLAGRLDQAERRLSGLQEDLLAVQKTAQSATATAGAAEEAARGVVNGAPVAGAAPADPRAAEAARALGEVLASEDGRRAFETAIKAYEQRRDEERGNRMVNGMVDAFAQRANLSPQQKEQMQKIAQRSMNEIGALWRSMRDQDVPAEERAARRQETVAKMEEIRSRTDEEVKGVLDASQWDLYQQESARMRGFMGGMGGDRGGFGGGGGGFGR